MVCGQVSLDYFLGDAGLDFLGHRAPGPALEAESREEEKGESIPGGCCPQCYYATGPVCRCSCGGRYHGLGAKLSRLDDYAGYEAIMEEAIIKLFEDADCLICGHSLSGAPVYGYEHPDGFNVDGRRLWVFAVCPGCGYQNSLAKIMALKRRVNPWIKEVE